jgi:protein-tyrosine sulfotransferase
VRARSPARSAREAVRSGDVFVHGVLPRSGTNYLARALRCHPDLCASPRSLWEFPHLPNSDPLVTYARSMARAPNLPELDEDDVLELVGDAWLEWASAGLPAGRRLVLKEPSVRNLDRFFRFFPRSFLVVLMRDGRDIACSSLRTSFAAPPRFRLFHPGTYRRAFRSPLGELARRWRDASRTVRAFLETPEGRARARVVRFEDLVREPDSQLRGMLEFLELPAEDFAWDSFRALGVRGSSFVGESGQKLDWSGRQPTPEDFDPVGRWRSWTEREVRRFDAVAGDELARWGYADAGDSV